MLKNVGAFLIVWSVWSFLDLTILSYHPWAEIAVFLLGVNLMIPWDAVRERLAHKPSRVVEEEEL